MGEDDYGVADINTGIIPFDSDELTATENIDQNGLDIVMERKIGALQRLEN